jgi:hypothetical protein
MNENDLTSILDKIQECSQKEIKIIKKYLAKMNFIILKSLDDNEKLIENNNYIPDMPQPCFSPKCVYWCTIDNEKKIIYKKDMTSFDVSDNASRIYIETSFYNLKLELPDNEIITEYISFVLSQKEKIFEHLKNKEHNLEKMPDVLEKFINEIKSKI